jgi:rhodanese-related sulfurtransferase
MRPWPCCGRRASRRGGWRTGCPNGRRPGGFVPDTQVLVFVLDENRDRGELARQCRTIDYDGRVGELAGGMAAWRAAGLPETQ